MVMTEACMYSHDRPFHYVHNMKRMCGGEVFGVCRFVRAFITESSMTAKRSE
jgi:hypothetical protein